MKQKYMSPVARMLQTFVLIFGCINLNAQTIVEPANGPEDGAIHGMTIYLKDGTTKTYTAAELQDITYLPGIGMKVYLKGSETSVDYLYSQMDKVDYAYTNANANWKTFSKTDYPYANRLEYPHLNANVWPTKEGAEEKSQIIVKQTTDYGITFSLEWDNAKIANRWTCYTLHADNSVENTDRNDDFKPDEDVAVSSALEDYKTSTATDPNLDFSRGHLCPSQDRQCSKEQNKQTFFLTNMQPQYQKHNGGLWGNLETLVNNYAKRADFTKTLCDTLYIVKAATITDKVTIDGQEVDGIYTDIKCGLDGIAIHKLLVPKYFYMAVLHYNKASNTYQGVAFWTLHQNASDTTTDLSTFAISIDELERRTGIDFFCNLPDEIEDVVEANVDFEFWKFVNAAQ
jgi:endonuclease G